MASVIRGSEWPGRTCAIFTSIPPTARESPKVVKAGADAFSSLDSGQPDSAAAIRVVQGTTRVLRGEQRAGIVLGEACADQMSLGHFDDFVGH
jgi:hypothetical protein